MAWTRKLSPDLFSALGRSDREAGCSDHVFPYRDVFADRFAELLTAAGDDSITRVLELCSHGGDIRRLDDLRAQTLDQR